MVMKELVDKILLAEEEAKNTIAAAKKEAAELLRISGEALNQQRLEVKQQTRDLVNTASEEAREITAAAKIPPLPEDTEQLLEDLGISKEHYEQTLEAVIHQLTVPEGLGQQQEAVNNKT